MSFQKPAIEVVAFPNKRKTHPKAPEFTGTITFNEAMVIEAGSKFDLALWNKVSKAGNAFQSGVIKPQQQQDVPGFEPEQKRGPVKIDF